MAKRKINIQIIAEDESILVVSKPAGVLTLPDRYDKSAFNLYDYFSKKYNDIFTVHRLDVGTSGVMVFAKTSKAHKNLNQQFQDWKVKKIYHVVVSGRIDKDEMDIDIPIMANPAKKGLSIPSARGKESLTKLKVIERFRHATLCEVNLVTGRHHQIRVHFSTIGHPLLIDKDYGENTEFLLSSIKRKYNLKKDSIERPIISRITMHAYEIEFLHPSTNELVSYKVEYPKDFTALLQILRKYSKIPEFSRPKYFEHL